MSVAAGLASLLLGLGFGIPGAIGAWHLARTGTVWTFLGFPAYGGGPFERIGINTTVPLLLAFVVVCAADVALGVAILMDAPMTGLLSVGLLLVGSVFWVGFALPFAPPLAVARTVLLLLD
jgi:hypothetical protein